MGKLHWYVKPNKKGTEIRFNKIWVWWQCVKAAIQITKNVFLSQNIKTNQDV